MADDINKKITIAVELEADKLTEDIQNLNKTIDSLLAKQQQLNTSGQQNSAAFEGISSKLDDLQKKLKDATTQVTANSTALTALSTSGKAAETSLSALTAQHQKNAKAAGDSSTKTKELGGQLTALGQAVNQQKSSTDQVKNSLDGYAGSISKGVASAQQLESNINGANNVLGAQAGILSGNKTAFDAHKITMDLLKTSFDEIKNVSGIFGPSLKEAAQGFGAMKSGLKLVQDGLTGVGTAIRADGFEFLLQILQLMFDYFVKSAKGSKILRGAISAIGVVVNQVKEYFHLFVDGIVNAFSHPIETLKSLGKMIEQNLINRFKAFGVILDGIIHLDFKKMANGAIQAFTGVTNATDKIGTAFNTVKKGVEDTADNMVSAFKGGYAEAGKHVEDHEKKVKESIDRQIGYFDNLSKKAGEAYVDAENHGDKKTSSRPDSNLTATAPSPGNLITPPNNETTLAAVKIIVDKASDIKKTALQQFEDYAKQSAGKIEADAMNLLTNSIKQQSAAKIAALEKDKTAELSNSSLTSAQKLAVQQKYKQQEAQVKIKAFKEEQEASIAQAVINGAIAITKAEAQTGVLGALVIPGIIAGTAVQVAKIAAQKPPAYAKGGLHYASDGRGGMLSGYSKTDNTNAYLRSGEGIVVSEAMQEPWARNLVSAINVGFGGRDFSITNPGKGYAVGGIFTDGGDANRYYNAPVSDQKNLANSIAYQMINNFPPVYVDVKDVNNQQNILAQTINRVNL
jgi:orotidine-5'-phosphate decarboxylase